MFEYFRKEYISQFRREPVSAVFTLISAFVLQRKNLRRYLVVLIFVGSPQRNFID